MKALAKALGASVLLGAALMPAESSAFGLKVTNSTPNMVWVAHAWDKFFSPTCQGGEGCGDGSQQYRVHGWWAIAPGGHAWVYTEDYHKSFHEWYGEDAFGHVWAGDGKSFCTPWDAFDICSAWGCGLNDRYISYRVKSHSACCGFWCSGDYGYINMIL